MDVTPRRDGEQLPAPLEIPVTRRRALVVIGSTVAGIALLDACGAAAVSAPSGWVRADVDPSNLPPDQPVPVRFAGAVGGPSVAGSAWLVRRSARDLVAFDPRCTHARCGYDWTSDDQFACLCHKGFFRIDGTVISGPPPRALDRFAVREIDGRIELEVPADFSTPRPSA
jgi:nitrite reductase/ring-hydroxylating ferredoxin subunit